MSNYKGAFNLQKATQAVDYFVVALGSRADKMKVLKLIWAADRYHIRKYGRLITNDSYYAMKHGPVGSLIKDVIDRKGAATVPDIDYSSRYFSLQRDGRTVTSVAAPDLSVFSQTDIEALKFALKSFGSLPTLRLRDLSHEYPEWKKHKRQVEENKRAQMSYADFFKNLKDPSQDLFSESEELLELTKELFEEEEALTKHLQQ